MNSLSQKGVRRLALARAGLLKRKYSGLPDRAGAHRGRGKRARDACHQIVERFGYLQLDTISVSGARTQGIVLASRLEGLDAALAEELLQPGTPFFEYWGHEACWMPMSLYPYFEFRRQEFQVHPWWGDVLAQHRTQAQALLSRIASEGPLRSTDLQAEKDFKRSRQGWWDIKLLKRIAECLWSCGELAIRERRNFQRIYDLPERVIPVAVRTGPRTEEESLDHLLLKALEGHGWATTGTLAATWRLRNRRPAILAALARLQDAGAITACELRGDDTKLSGWIRPSDLELANKLEDARIYGARPVLLSPFDPVLWDRVRTKRLFGFDLVIEIYKPRTQREFGYYCLPVLSGEHLVGRVDLKAHRRQGKLEVLARHRESPSRGKTLAGVDHAIDKALTRFAAAVALELA